MPWQGRKEDHHLHKLHRELYENNEKHAGDVYYALVCSDAKFTPEENEDIITTLGIHNVRLVD